jgi:stringent starvation protein B
MGMTSNRPYLVRAYHEWIVDNGCTPYLVVNAFADGVEVPQSYVSNGQIILNIAPRTVRNFSMDNERISFNTRFSGLATDIDVPIDAVMGIYAHENGQGIVFESGTNIEPPPVDPTPGSGGDTDGKKSRLRLIK